MNPTLSPSIPSRLLSQGVRGVFRHLPKALAGDADNVHEMRVATRRLRVALAVLATKPEGRRVRRALGVLRDLTRAAGGSRDLDVCVDLFEKRWEASDKPAELALLRRRLRATRGRSRHRMAEALMDLEIAGLRRDLRSILARGGEDIFIALGRLRQIRDDEGTRLLALIADLGDAYDPEGLHKARIVARRLRYVGEVAEGLRGQELEGTGQFKELQTRLGHVRDHHVLASWLLGQASAAAARGQSSLARQARREAAFFREESHRHHRRLLEQSPTAFTRRALVGLGQNPSHDAGTA